MYKHTDEAWFDEPKAKIVSLGKGSDKPVRAVCPYCGSSREVRFSAVSGNGTYCRGCKKLETSERETVGKTINGVYVSSAAKPSVDKSGKRLSRLNCICFCGKKFVALACNIKSGHTKSCGCLIGANRFGSNNPNFNHKKTKERREEDIKKRKTAEYKAWKKKVFESFGCCFVCGSTKNLEAHHVEGFMSNDESRYDKQNGVCLCKSCHRKYHVNFLGSYKVQATKSTFTHFMEWIKCR